MAASALIGATSCQDFLDEENKTGMTADLTYSTESGIEGLVRSCYAATRGWWGKEAGLGLSECGTDLFLNGFDNKQVSLVTYTFTPRSLNGNASNDPCFDHYWQLFYANIDVCNNALEYIEKNSVISESKKQQYRGEVHFLRALYYFNLVSTWGPVPYNDKPVNAQSYTPTRMPEHEVFGKILDDLKVSMDNFQQANFMTKADGGEQARANFYAAKALAARVSLFAASWLGKDAVSGHADLYQEAQKHAEDVIANSGTEFYARYSDVWNLNNESVVTNKEAIWGVYYDNDLTTANCIPYRYDGSSYNSLITRTGYSRGGSAMNLMFVSMWSNGVKDGLGGNNNKEDNLYIRALGVSGKNKEVNSAKTGKPVDIQKFYSPYGRGFTRYLPSLYLWRTLESRRATDQRVDGTLLTHYICPPDLEENPAKFYPKMGEFMTDPEEAYAKDGNYFNAGDTAIFYCHLDGDSPEGKAQQEWAKDRYRIQFATGGDIPVYTENDLSKAVATSTAKAVSDVYGDDRYNNVNIGGWKSYPGIKKFLDDQLDERFPTHDITYRDQIVFRLSEMYLIKAECELMTGGDAAGTINAIRTARAIAGQDNSLTGAVDIDVILEERAIELCGEQLRWFDLKRTHKLIEYVKARNGAAAANIQTMHYYRPIPEDQMMGCTNVVGAPAGQNADGVLDYKSQADGFWQNPGY